MSESKWPFKRIKQHSSWPAQAFVVQVATVIMQVPAEVRKMAAHKEMERFVRVAIRLGAEWTMDPVKFLEMTEQLLIKEWGPATKERLDEYRAEQREKWMSEGAALDSGNLLGFLKDGGDSAIT